VRSGTPFTVVVNFPGGSGQVFLAINTGPAGGFLQGPTSANVVNGQATFSGVVLPRAGVYTLQAFTSTIPAVVSSSINVMASQLVASVNPARPKQNRNFTINLLALDATGNVAANYSQAVTLTVVKRPSRGRLRGPLSGIFSGGQLTLAPMKVTRAGEYRVMVTTSDGLSLLLRIVSPGRRRA
jgi:hypothetical protein